MNAQPEESLKEFLKNILVMLCPKTKEPLVRYDPQDRVFIIRVDPCEHGRCVGKHGIVIWAISTVMYYAGSVAFGHPVRVDLLAPSEGPGHRLAMPFKFNPAWDRQAMSALIGSLIGQCFNGNRGAWVIEERSQDAVANLQVDSSLKSAISDPDLLEALSVIIRYAGMAGGVSIKTSIQWN